MTENAAIATLRARLETTKFPPDAFDFVSLQGAAWAIGKSKRQVERMIKQGDFLAGEVSTRKGSRRLSIAALVRWHEDGLIPEDRAA